MSDYSWFELEIAAVPWRTFYILDKESDHVGVTRRSYDLKLPKEYVQFLERYGEARLFRRLKSDSHFLTVLNPIPKPECGGPGTFLIGGYWLEGNAYILNGESGIYAWSSGKLRQVSVNFDEWFRSCFRKAKRGIKKEQWELLRKPPMPFSQTEMRLARALCRYQFTKLDVEPNKNVKIEISNKSIETLEWVKMGVSAPTLKGAIELAVSGLEPGTSKIISQDCYKDMVPPETVFLFPFPEPTPEDRWAFRALRVVNGFE